MLDQVGKLAKRNWKVFENTIAVRAKEAND